jgi:hypothetical protein
MDLMGAGGVEPIKILKDLDDQREKQHTYHEGYGRKNEIRQLIHALLKGLPVARAS